MESVQSISSRRRGISPVVATVALVLITISAAMFIAGFVVPFVRNQLNEGTECVGYEEYFTFYEGFDYNCYVEIGNNYLYALSIESDTLPEEKFEKVNGLKIQFLGGGESKGVEIKNSLPAGKEEGKVRMLDKTITQLALPERGGVRTYVYNSSAIYESIEAYPILKSGRTCGKTDEIKILNCKPGVGLEV